MSRARLAMSYHFFFTVCCNVSLLALLIMPHSTTAMEVQPKKFFQQYESSEATRILMNVQRLPFDENSRRSISQLYARLGYLSASYFFGATATYIEEGTFRPLQTPLVKETWSCADPKENVVVREKALEIFDLVKRLEFESAVLLAQKIMSTDSASCRIAIEWARAKLLETTKAQGKNIVITSELELAIRWLITSSNEIRVYPLNLESRAEVYHLLSGYFSMKSDYISAYIAANFALDELESASSIQKEALEDALIDARDRLRSYAENQRINRVAE